MNSDEAALSRSESDWINLIREQRRHNSIEQSAQTCRQAIAIGMSTARIHTQLAHSLKLLGQKESARQEYEFALKLDPNYAFAYRSYGAMLSGSKHHYQEAEQILRKGLELDPTDVGMWVSLGNVHSQLGQMAKAVECYRHAQALNPNDPFPAAAYLFAMNYQPDVTAEQIYDQACIVGRNCSLNVKPYTQWHLEDTVSWSERPSKLKVGFVSPDLRNHPVGYFLENVIPFLRKDVFEWYAFSSVEAEDSVRGSLKKAFDAWIDVSGLAHPDLARTIHAQGIHILIDLAGYTAKGSIGAFAYRPAPVQANWLGWFATTGLPAMDYLLSDQISVRGIEQHFAEQLIELPHTRLCMMPPSTPASVTALPAKSNGFVTYGCVQNLAKINDEWLSVWREILQKVPNARLQIQSKHFSRSVQRKSFHERLQKMGLPSERITLLPPRSREHYLNDLSNIDVLLDTYPYPGGTTTAEGLWMGVPTLTCMGNTMISRQGASLLNVVGLSDWVAQNRAEYIQKAVSWATRIEALSALRAHLRNQVAQSPLFNGKKFAHGFEAAMEEMWQRSSRQYTDDALLHNR